MRRAGKQLPTRVGEVVEVVLTVPLTGPGRSQGSLFQPARVSVRWSTSFFVLTLGNLCFILVRLRSGQWPCGQGSSLGRSQNDFEVVSTL